MTIDAPCPNCGTIYTVRRELIGKRTKCTRCGTPFTIAESATSYAPPPPPPPPVETVFPDIPIQQTYTPRPTPEVQSAGAAHPSGAGKRVADFFGFETYQSHPRYPALNMVARGYEFLAIVVLIISAVALVIMVVRIIQNPSGVLFVLSSTGLVFAWGLATALGCLFCSQATRLALQIERNTWETQKACRQLADHLTAIEVEK
jgi:predicted Zn finger-like uncharacterized protein